MLLERFHIGLWSSMTKLKLFPLLQHIISAPVMKNPSFIFSREDYHDFRNYASCYKMCYIILIKITSKAMCTENQILFMDVRPFLLRHNPNVICYLPYPFIGEIHYPNESRVIPNVATDIIPFIYPLYRFASIAEYIMHVVRSGQRHYIAQQHL